jgi:hypothetical protein
VVEDKDVQRAEGKTREKRDAERERRRRKKSCRRRIKRRRGTARRTCRRTIAESELPPCLDRGRG